ELVRIANQLEVEEAKRQSAIVHDNGADPSRDRGGTGHGRGSGKGKRRGGKRPLEISDPVKVQVYDRIKPEHRKGQAYVDAVARLKGDKDFVEQVERAGLKLNTTLVKKALALFDSRKRDEERKKQETGPA